MVIATFFHCDSWRELGRFALPYAEYRFREGRWVWQSLSAQWIGHPANILAASPSRKAVMNKRELLTVERKAAIIEDSSMAPEYRRVVDRWKSDC